MSHYRSSDRTAHVAVAAVQNTSQCCPASVMIAGSSLGLLLYFTCFAVPCKVRSAVLTIRTMLARAYRAQGYAVRHHSRLECRRSSGLLLYHRCFVLLCKFRPAVLTVRVLLGRAYRTQGYAVGHHSRLKCRSSSGLLLYLTYFVLLCKIRPAVLTF